MSTNIIYFGIDVDDYSFPITGIINGTGEILETKCKSTVQGHGQTFLKNQGFSLDEGSSIRGIDDTKIVMDGGPENNNFSVLRFSASHRMQRLIAMVDIHFSNPMAESLF